MKKIKRVLGGIIIIILLGVWAFNSPFLATMVIRMLFHGGDAVKPEDYQEIVEKVQIDRNISYHSKYKQGFFDLVYPKNQNSALPVIVWVHGGGFVGGDKSDIEEYAVQLASNGYVVVNINYALAPEAKYPTPINQLEELYQFLMENAEVYQLDMSRVFFAGDSAGAHIVTQFVLVQTNEDYAKLVDRNAIMDTNTIQGMLLFCGPYDMEKFVEIGNNNAIIKFLLYRVLWGYTGIREVSDNYLLKELSLIDYVNEGFPDTFITDGNTFTFMQQGIDFAHKLESLGVYVKAVFYETDEKLIHEYQFKMDNEFSYHTFSELLLFLMEANTHDEQK